MPGKLVTGVRFNMPKPARGADTQSAQVIRHLGSQAEANLESIQDHPPREEMTTEGVADVMGVPHSDALAQTRVGHPQSRDGGC